MCSESQRSELKGREIVLQTSQPDLEREVGGEEEDSLTLPKPDETSGAQGQQLI